MAERHGFEQRRSLAAPRTFDQRLRSFGREDHVVAIDRDAPHAVCLTEARDPIARLAQPDVEMTRVEVVLANEQHGEIQDCGEVQRFVEGAFLARAIAEIAHRYAAVGVHLRRQARAHRDRDGCADERNAAVESDLAAEQVHRAAHAARDAILLPEDLREQAVDIAAERKEVRVGAMPAEHAIARC